MDTAGQKGTGKWTAINALDLEPPRSYQAQKFQKTPSRTENNLSDDLEQALYASKIISYAQGFMLIREAAATYGWKLNNPAIALMWRGGCIIRSVFLGQITKAYREEPDLENLLFNKFFADAVTKAQSGWRKSIALATTYGIPTPAFSTALSFYDGVLPECASDNLPVDKDIHINWTGHGGNVSSSTYQA
ncbi:phosphogluconate dehydrogenase (decarboxylating) gnd1 [Fusarium falciforme]|nr:phosphogluconate dehydrogenase (decarboxylating) gnd1 [Fusarium falciforme]